MIHPVAPLGLSSHATHAACCLSEGSQRFTYQHQRRERCIENVPPQENQAPSVRKVCMIRNRPSKNPSQINISLNWTLMVRFPNRTHRHQFSDWTNMRNPSSVPVGDYMFIVTQCSQSLSLRRCDMSNKKRCPKYRPYGAKENFIIRFFYKTYRPLRGLNG